MASTTLRTTALLALVVSAVGTVALFLPFTFDVSPLSGLQDHDRVWMLAVPFFLAPVMLYMALRLSTAGAISPVERRVAGALSLAVVLLTASFYVLPSENDKWPSSELEWTSFIAPLVLFVVEAGLLWRLRRRVSPDLFALAALVCAYLPNAVLCLIAFGDDWQVGAHVTLATVMAYGLVASLIWRVHHASQAG